VNKMTEEYYGPDSLVESNFNFNKFHLILLFLWFIFSVLSILIIVATINGIFIFFIIPITITIIFVSVVFIYPLAIYLECKYLDLQMKHEETPDKDRCHKIQYAFYTER